MTTALLGVMSGLLIAAPGVALAGNCTGIGRARLCGNVRNRSSEHDVIITTDWGKRNEHRTWKALPSGKDGPDIKVRDVDGFLVPKGCEFTLAGIRHIGPGWYKIFDGQNIQISSINC
ncbi:hypothetical protein [Archangium sp.]|uniref:hypothetical protein n=1 Tax=Archangium sp. TaxID=1872627 RepID=UPI002EDA9159